MKTLSQLSLLSLVLVLFGCVGMDTKTRVSKTRTQFSGDIVNAGIVYSTPTGGEEAVAKSFPYSSSIIKANNLNAALKSRLEKISKPGCRIITEDLATSKQNAISIALSIDSERDFTSYISGINQYKLEVIVNASIVLFDFHTKSILASYPFMVSYAKNYKSEPGAAEKMDIFSEIFSAQDTSVNVFKYAADMLKDIEIYRSYDSTIGVSNVGFSPEAESSMQALEFDSDSSKIFIASLFNGAVSKNFKVPMLPYSYNGSEIFYVMADGYTNGDKLSNELLLKNPNPTYQINLDLGKLSYRKLRKEGNAFGYGFVSGYEIDVRNISSATIFKKRIALGTSAVYTTQFNGRGMHLAQLFYNLVSLFDKKTAKEIKENDKFEKFLDILEECK